MSARKLTVKGPVAESPNQTNYIEWECVFCRHRRKGVRIEGVDRTVIRCKGECAAETVHVALA